MKVVLMIMIGCFQLGFSPALAEGFHTIAPAPAEAEVCLSCLKEVQGYQQIEDIEKIAVRLCLDSAVSKTSWANSRLPLKQVKLNEGGTAVEGFFYKKYRNRSSEGTVVSCEKTESGKWVASGGYRCSYGGGDRGCAGWWGIYAQK